MTARVISELNYKCKYDLLIGSTISRFESALDMLKKTFVWADSLSERLLRKQHSILIWLLCNFSHFRFAYFFFHAFTPYCQEKTNIFQLVNLFNINASLLMSYKQPVDACFPFFFTYDISSLLSFPQGNVLY